MNKFKEMQERTKDDLINLKMFYDNKLYKM